MERFLTVIFSFRLDSGNRKATDMEDENNCSTIFLRQVPSYFTDRDILVLCEPYGRVVSINRYEQGNHDSITKYFVDYRMKRYSSV